MSTFKTFAYLRASTLEQRADRAKESIEEFARLHNLTIEPEDFYLENESGATLKRPELFALMRAVRQGDAIVIESIDRLSRLAEPEWKQLRGMIESKGVRLIVMDIPTTYAQMSTDETVGGIMRAINGMLLDMFAVMARKDYTLRRERQKQGIARAKGEGKYKGKAADMKKIDMLAALVAGGMTVAKAAPKVGYTYLHACKVIRKIRAGEMPEVMKQYPRLANKRD
ncbi:recombinase family protein [Salmonella enterica]